MKQQISIRVRDLESYDRHATKLVAIEASPVKGHKYEPEIKLFLHKAFAYDSGWVVTELSTGFAFTRGAMRAEALQRLKDLYVSKAEALRTIKDFVDRYGPANA